MRENALFPKKIMCLNCWIFLLVTTTIDRSSQGRIERKGRFLAAFLLPKSRQKEKKKNRGKRGERWMAQKLPKRYKSRRKRRRKFFLLSEFLMVSQCARVRGIKCLRDPRKEVTFFFKCLGTELSSSLQTRSRSSRLKMSLCGVLLWLFIQSEFKKLFCSTKEVFANDRLPFFSGTSDCINFDMAVTFELNHVPFRLRLRSLSNPTSWLGITSVVFIRGMSRTALGSSC